MRYPVGFLLPVLFVFSATAFELKGRLVSENGAPFASCQVELAHSTQKLTTGADGQFALTGVASVHPRSSSPIGFEARFRGDNLALRVPSGTPGSQGSVEAFSAQGARLFSRPFTAGENGEASLNLAADLRNGAAQAIQFFRVSAEGQSETFAAVGRSAALASPVMSKPEPAWVLSKVSAPGMDTVVVQCPGFPARRLAASSPNLGDIRIARPNIILMMLDDMGYSDLGSYGSEISTPNLDKLAAEGLRFRQFFNSGKCESTRASLVSGLYWHDAKLGIKSGITLGEAMKGAGYTTMTVGKWHLDGNPHDRGFDRAFGHLSGAADYFNPGTGREYHLDGKPYSKPAGAKDWYITNVNTDFAMQFIEEEKTKNPNKPVFLYYAPNAPHNPLQALPKDIAKYRGKYMKGWDKLREERYQRQLDMGLFTRETAPLSDKNKDIPAWSSLIPRHQDIEDSTMAIYAAMMDNVDQNVGRIMAKLRELDIDDNTLILFMSDNGANGFTYRYGALGTGNWGYGAAWANLSNTPYRLYKRAQHNGGNCTPLIAWWPGVISQAGGFTDYRGHIIDMMPTFLDLGKGTYPKTFAGQSIPPLPGKSLAPLFEGKALDRGNPLFFHLIDQQAVISGDWKLVSGPTGGWELYRLNQDLTETKDLFASEKAKADEMINLWKGYESEKRVVMNEGAGSPVYEPHN